MCTWVCVKGHAFSPTKQKSHVPMPERVALVVLGKETQKGGVFGKEAQDRNPRWTDWAG